MLSKVKILGVNISNGSKDQILEEVFVRIEDQSRQSYIVTPNPEIIVYAQSHARYRDILNNADIALCDGVGVLLAGKLLGVRLTGRVTGVELMEAVCRESVKKAVVVGFLGGKDGVALEASKCLSKKYPGLKVGFVGEESFETMNLLGLHHEDLKNEMPNVREGALIDHDQGKNIKRIDVLFVAYGFPKQEEWINQNLPKYPIGVAMGVGGAFDFVSGRVRRAPFFVRAIGMEWFFRLFVQPWRIRRQLRLLEFVGIVIMERLMGRYRHN